MHHKENPVGLSHRFSISYFFNFLFKNNKINRNPSQNILNIKNEKY